MVYELSGKRVWVAGHLGMVGRAIVRRLQGSNCEIITAGRDELDLRRQTDVERWTEKKRPHAVFVAAASVGGILANDTRPVDFLYDNLTIETNVIESARRIGVEKLLFLGSSCIYPRLAPQPITEESLLTGPLESTNQWYAVAKIAGIMLCRAYRRQFGLNFISVMPTNLYGPNDNFDLASSHVVPALIAKAHAAKLHRADEIAVWGTGKPLREFLHVDDLADAAVFLFQNYSGEEHINIGVGSDISIKELAELVLRIVGVSAALRFDSEKPDGTPRKLLNSGRLFAMGWRPRIGLEQGLRQTYDWYCNNMANAGQPTA
ncbi:MAG: GDP-L-fucose synthase [Fimbriimonadaceae bacterium]|nr:GDP-L-fucose synthase [Alphaproteobacteria bacterium]